MLNFELFIHLATYIEGKTTDPIIHTFFPFCSIYSHGYSDKEVAMMLFKSVISYAYITLINRSPKTLLSMKLGTMAMLASAHTSTTHTYTRARTHAHSINCSNSQNLC